MSLSRLEKGAIGAVCALVLLALAMDVPGSRPPVTRTAYPPTPYAEATRRAQEEASVREATAKAEAERLAAVQTPAETEDILPAGHGRAETFARCTACHSTAIIRRSGFTQDRWDELMDWMTEKQGMAPLDGADRALIVGYLAQQFPPRRNPRNASPFLN
ncbi:hypothetical protein [Roseomonas populi]|uniref:Cytochrome c n=1 Tax=Roseomonas populi TaxID=3121582 RepID=A0ABT1X422_9PROT|nr:hypothetical protein [Roseomonas pecuniae]MCR0982827.1 hypothetical protein [Roseomonas pecuniae]